MKTTMVATTEEGRDEDDNNEADNTKGEEGGGDDPAVEDGKDKDDEDDKEDDEEDIMDVLPPLLARRVERPISLNTERERVMERYLEERAALEMKYLYLCNPIYKKIGNVVARRLDDMIMSINNEGGVE